MVMQGGLRKPQSCLIEGSHVKPPAGPRHVLRVENRDTEYCSDSGSIMAHDGWEYARLAWSTE